MFNVQITPNLLNGKVSAPPSKSVAHRLLICAALASGTSTIRGLEMSKDIIATIEALSALGAQIETSGSTATVHGISCNSVAKNAEINCNESGSTLRFLIPIASALGADSTFLGKGKLPERPITPYLSELTKNGVTFEYNNTMPFSVSGKLKAGVFTIDGGISSQFITGLLFALPLLDADSEIKITSTLQSKPYVDITIGCLNQFGIEIIEKANSYFVKGNQQFKPTDAVVEGDYSQAAFYYVANAIGNNIKIDNLNTASLQGDKKIVEIVEQVMYNKDNGLKPFKIDASDIPDIVPIMTVLATFCDGISEITNVARLRIKESDRLEAISTCVNKIGGNVIAKEDALIIHGVGTLKGGTVDSYNDHRIAMSMAIAATRCTEPLTIMNAGCVEKSYPNFYNDYSMLGGKVNVINVE